MSNFELALISLLFCAILFLKSIGYRFNTTTSELPVANRKFLLEPPYFAKLRWAFNSRTILDEAYTKFKGRLYRVDRGDIELLVIPMEFIPELNLLSESTLSSRMAHSYNLLGHINGVDIVKTSNLYFKTILNKLTPALPKLTPSLKLRIGHEIESIFPRSSKDWTIIEPLHLIVHAISSAFSMIAVGPPLSNDPEHTRLMSEQAKLVFEIVILMRFVPSVLQPLLVWLLPAKWHLRRNLKTLESFVVPEAKSLLTEKSPAKSTLLSWMIQSAQTDVERDSYILTKLQAATAAGGTHSVGMFIDRALFDIVARPSLLEKILDEIQKTNEMHNGLWDFACYDSLYKLDSALKETARVGPPTMTVYNRLMLSDYTLSNGVTLNKGQMICVSGCSIQSDDDVFPDAKNYDGLRAYNKRFQDHREHSFKFADSELGWGSGRWACPGRFLATLEAKIILVKLLCEYDFQLLPGKSLPERITFHDYGFIGEHEKLMVRRKDSLIINLGY